MQDRAVRAPFTAITGPTARSFSSALSLTWPRISGSYSLKAARDTRGAGDVLNPGDAYWYLPGTGESDNLVARGNLAPELAADQKFGRHNGGLIVAFCDGHVKFTKPQVLVKPVPPPTWSGGSSRGNGPTISGPRTFWTRPAKRIRAPFSWSGPFRALRPRLQIAVRRRRTPMNQRNIWANLLHLSYNFWSDWQRPEVQSPYYAAKPYLRFDDGLWNDLLKAMAGGGLNLVILDLGDGVRYQNHPEIAVEGAWSVERLKQELQTMRALGLEPIPKLNFSTCHDQWLGPYARRVSTPEYYAVAGDLIAEVIQIFDTPRFFHLGMDEEELKHQKHFEYVVIRQYDLWWRDFYFFVEQVEKNGVRAWIWSDYLWEHPELFWAKMPKTVLQSNWYYGASFARDLAPVKAYLDLEARGFDQVPTLSNWTTPENIASTVRFCQENIAPERLYGFLLAPWRPTLEACRARHEDAIAHFAHAKAATLPAGG